MAPLSAVQGLAQDQHCSAAEDVAVFIGVLLPREERSPYGQLLFADRFPVDVARLACSWVELWVAVLPPSQMSLSHWCLIALRGAFSSWTTPVGLPVLGGCRAICLQLV